MITESVRSLYPWLAIRPEGLYCVPGDFYIDPWVPVERAVVTHGHADHARGGNEHVLATPETLDIMRVRYREYAGEHLQGLAYGETVHIGDARLRFAPAGHILGSAQAVLEYGGERIVVSGDYKRAPDPTCPPFEAVPCDVFITEATFAMPVFTHPDPLGEARKLLDSLADFPDKAHVVGVYALGKCQRLMCLLRQLGYDKPIYLHGAHVGLTEMYAHRGVPVGEFRKVAESEKPAKKAYTGEIILCPPSELHGRWSRRFGEHVTALASGWMRIRARARQKGIDLPLVISDHADWSELTQTLHEVNPKLLLITHGTEEALLHYATEHGYRAEALSLAYGGREDDE